MDSSFAVGSALVTLAGCDAHTNDQITVAESNNAQDIVTCRGRHPNCDRLHPSATRASSAFFDSQDAGTAPANGHSPRIRPPKGRLRAYQMLLLSYPRSAKLSDLPPSTIPQSRRSLSIRVSRADVP